MQSPVLSFVIPVRNDAAQLRHCLASIQANTGDVPRELIVGDNGSTDSSADVARAAGATVLALPNRPVADVRNSAARAARGEFIAFVDSDHELAPGWCEAVVRAFGDSSVTAVGAQCHAPSNGTWVQQTYDRLRRHQPGSHFVEWLPSGNMVVRRKAFEEVGGFDTSLETCEDVDLSQRLSQKGARLLAVDKLYSIHFGDPKTLAALFRGELWRGRDNLRVSLRVPLTLRSAPGLLIPLVTLAALALILVGLVTWPWGGWRLAAAGIVVVGGVAAVRALSLVVHAEAGHRGLRTAAQAMLFALVFNLARALAIVARSGHDVRRKAS